MDLVSLMKLSTKILCTAAATEQRLRVATEFGAIAGYLIDIDDHDLLMFTQFQRENRPEFVWTMAVIPRTTIILIDQAHLKEETQEVQETYRLAVGNRFSDFRPENNISNNAEEQ